MARSVTNTTLVGVRKNDCLSHETRFYRSTYYTDGVADDEFDNAVNLTTGFVNPDGSSGIEWNSSIVIQQDREILISVVTSGESFTMGAAWTAASIEGSTNIFTFIKRYVLDYSYCQCNLPRF